MKRFVASLLFAATAAIAAGHTIGSAGAPPADLGAPLAGMLQKDGVKVLDGQKTVAEIWFRSSLPAGPKAAEGSVTLPTVPHGTLFGVIRFPATYADRRGQTLKPGAYTMRFSYYPENGDHQGVAPQRDFLLLTPIAEDKDLNATPSFEPLVAMSRKASGTPHPAVFSIWKVDSGFKPGLTQEGEHDWVLQTKLGDTQIAMVVAGKTEH